MPIRKANLKDVESVVLLWKEFMRENNSFKSKEVLKVDQFNNDASNLFRKFVINNIKSKNSVVLVAEEKSKIVGFIQAQIKDNLKVYKVKKIGHISDLFVKRNYRKRNMSSVLKNFAFKWFKSKKIKYVSLQTEIRNKLAHKIYEKWGFFEHNLTLYKKL
ncbi:hypothetical protein CMO83_01355 [Candidatus Woesearchaeota archaeon]|jgi:ribosomal protein S18 acetylase RimI-like enzyme|nr:hypothetical protein [Candidatus Woesearchaeota archaeon]MDP6647961.1 GNAT family N-acetyltransferase [Candidatus Woesearchaeota archaeon]|tara:strand:+ start:1325 stop:1804 length:480 start_codon:yes stop_codon:yes gene_type:complete